MRTTWHHGPDRYRYAVVADIADFAALLADPEVGRWLWFTPAPPSAFDAFFRPLLEAQAQALATGQPPDAAVFVIEDEGGFLGEGAVVPVDGSPDGFEIGYQLARSAWRRGVGTRLAWFLVAYAIHVRHAYRIEAGCLEGNRGSRTLLERVGLSLEGRRPGYRLRDGVRHTELLYGAEVSQLDLAEIARVARTTGLLSEPG